LNSPQEYEWNSNDKYRFCLDIRKVNSSSKQDAYLLPNINGIFDKLHSARYISAIDLSRAYFQIPLVKENHEITFNVSVKIYIILRECHTVTGALATFQRLLDRLISPEMEPFAFT